MDTPNKKTPKEPTLSDLLSLILETYWRRLHYLTPTTKGEWYGAGVLLLGLLLILLGLFYLLKEYRFRQQQSHLKQH
jgi:hypothetical protein